MTTSPESLRIIPFKRDSNKYGVYSTDDEKFLLDIGTKADLVKWYQKRHGPEAAETAREIIDAYEADKTPYDDFQGPPKEVHNSWRARLLETGKIDLEELHSPPPLRDRSSLVGFVFPGFEDDIRHLAVVLLGRPVANVGYVAITASLLGVSSPVVFFTSGLVVLSTVCMLFGLARTYRGDTWGLVDLIAQLGILLLAGTVVLVQWSEFAVVAFIFVSFVGFPIAVYTIGLYGSLYSGL